MERVGVDILGLFPVTDQGSCYALVAMNYFTKWPEANVVPDQSAATTAEKLLGEMFCHSEELHSDQGRDFQSKVFQEVCQCLGVKKTRTTPLHSQSDGLVERFNRTLSTQLDILTDKQQRDWDHHLLLILWFYQTAVQESTKCTPAALLFEHELWTWYLGPLQNQSKEGVQQKWAYDTRCWGDDIAPSTKVWVYNLVRKKVRSPKLSSHWMGPCIVLEFIFISAPNIFHVGVDETVFVQIEKNVINEPVTLYLEHESTGTVVSNKKIAQNANQIVELKVNIDEWSRLPPSNPPYLALVAESNSLRSMSNCPNPPSYKCRNLHGRVTTKVLVSKHRGYIFIQTDQPMYNPEQKVNYRISLLKYRIRTLYDCRRRVLRGTFPIPDVSKTGIWNITAHYDGDEEMLHTESHSKEILYSHGEDVKGAYHSKFALLKKGETTGGKMDVISGLEQSGSVKDGRAEVVVELNSINLALKQQLKRSLSDMQQSGERLYLSVFVTNIKSGEMQNGEVYLPIYAHKYVMDLSLTRSHFVPGFPLDVVVVMRHHNGARAAEVPVSITLLQASTRQSTERFTDPDGIASHSLNLQHETNIIVEASAHGLNERKTIQRFHSPSGSYLYITFTSKLYSVNELFSVTYNTVNGPNVGHIYYMVISRGRIIENGFHKIGVSVKHNMQITADMVPSFRLIAYYHNSGGDLIADSVWVDVKDECKIKVKVSKQIRATPGMQAQLEFDLHGQSAKVALLAVDKAFYALKADNKLTAKQVFSTMKSYDLGCSYDGGSDSASVLLNSGLSFVSDFQSGRRKDFGCNHMSVQHRRSIDLQEEMMKSKSNFSDPTLQECCAEGFSAIPMERTCEERADRVLLVKKNQTCVEAFQKCCLQAETLRKQKKREEALKGFGKTASTSEIEEFLLTETQYIRRFFPPSFEFIEFDVKDKKSHFLTMPDSITTWEIQIMTLSPTTGFCVAEPSEVKAFKKVFVSLRLPALVKKYEQLSITPVIYNYDTGNDLKVAVHMVQAEGLCSPGSATTASFVNITVKPQSSQFVSFSAVPMKTGSIPIIIRVVDIETTFGIDGVEKNLIVQTEGLEKRDEVTEVVNLDGKSTKTITIDRTLPDDTVPGSSSNIFVSMEGNGFGKLQARNLLSPTKVANLINLPTGCVEQTMSKLAPTALALRYLDLTDQWFDLPDGSRDDAMYKIEFGYKRILDMKKNDWSYKPWRTERSSSWLTAYILKVLSLVAQIQTAASRHREQIQVVPLGDIRKIANYLVQVENADGSFSDPHRVLHNRILEGKDRDVSMSAFITIALNHSLEFLPADMQKDVEARMSRATQYLQSQLEQLKHPYAVAITAYCLAVRRQKGADHSGAWARLSANVKEDKDGCFFWTTDEKQSVGAITIETTAYALLTAVELGDSEWAKNISCWLNAQEKYGGGFKSTQDTIVALEALAKYALMKSSGPQVNVNAKLTTSGRNEIVTLSLEDRNEKVETDLKKLKGGTITVEFTGKGEVKFKIVKAYHLLQPPNDCEHLSLSVKVEGKVEYTAHITQNYDYYDYYTNQEKQKRKENHDQQLSGFDVLCQLKQPGEQYITHYEESDGRLLIYFNELYSQKECISFNAKQLVPVGLLQPASAVFYDYYEPDRRCTVFYSAPKRSRMVSKLCSEDVCQCAERPCHKLQDTFKSINRRWEIRKHTRVQHACAFPTADYTYIVKVHSIDVKSNFELYNTTVTEVLQTKSERTMSKNSVCVFAKRLQCKVKLEVGETYLIMGKYLPTKGLNRKIPYLLESSTWVEKVPSDDECKKSAHRIPCKEFKEFVDEYKLNGCTE
ncbi:LOW QUALITY PROTEIN: complement C4-B [Pholidichthys leucotaenia]